MAEKQSDIEAFSQPNASMNQVKLGLMESRDALANEVAELIHVRNELYASLHCQEALPSEAKEIFLQMDEYVKHVEAMQSQIDLLTVDRDTCIQHTVDLQAEVDALQQANVILVEERKAFSMRLDEQSNDIKTITEAWGLEVDRSMQLKHEVDLLQIDIKSKQERIDMLETACVENEARQRYLNGEILKAEAQIELIKDILLREAGI